MATISIADNDARKQYTQAVTANTTQLTIDFPFFSLDDINVIVTNTSGVDTTLTRGTGTGTFAVVGTSVDDGFSGGHITLGDTYPSGTKFTIFRDIPVERTTDFPTSGPFNVSALNTELDKIFAVEQELETKIGRTMKLADSDTAASLTLPNLDTRKGTTLAFNTVTGLPEAGPKIGDVSTIAAITADISTLADIEDGTDSTDAIQTVASIQSAVTGVNNISQAVSNVNSNSTNIDHVAGQISPTNNISSVAGKVTEIGLLGNSATIADMGLLGNSTVIADMALLANTDVIADMAALADTDVIADMNALNQSDIIADMNALNVSGVLSDMATVASRETEINTLAGIDSQIQAVAGVASDITSLASVLGANTTYTVTVASGVFYIDGASNPTLTFDRGNTYIFDQSDSSNAGHPLVFRNSSSQSYTTGVTVTGTAGNAGAQVQIDVASNAPSSLLYACNVHGNGMGNTISVVNSNLATVASNITNVNNVGGSITNVNALAATDVLADMAALNNTDVLADMAALNNTDVLADMAALGESAVVADMAALNTTDVLADMAALNDTTVLANMALLGTSDAVADMALLGTADAVADMNTLATSDVVADMNTLADIAADITTLAHIEDGTDATDAIQTVASMNGQVTSFAQKYRIGSSDPTLDNDEGDLFYNTTSNELKVYSNTAWVKVGNDVNVMDRYEFVASSGQTIFTGTDANNNTLAINTSSYFVTINGGMIESTDINSVTTTALTLTSDAAAEVGDYVTVTSFNKFAPTNALTSDGTAQSKSGNLTISGGALFNVDGSQGTAPGINGHAAVINRGLAITKRGADGNPDTSNAYGTYAQNPQEYNLYIESTDSFAGGIAMRGKHAQLALNSEDSHWGFHFGGNTTKNVTVSRHGISFNNSLNYTTTPTAANSMNHYEQGTWTPILADAASSGNEITPSVDSATFTRIGNVVHLAFSDQNVGISPTSGTYSNLDSGNDVFIKGLPYSLNHRFTGAITGEFSYTTGESPVVYGETGNSYLKIALMQNNNSALDFVVFGGMSAYSGFHFQITYFTDDA